MLTNPQGVSWPGWSADAFRMRWLSFYERAHAIGLDPFLLLEDALDMETLGWCWGDRDVRIGGLDIIRWKNAYVRGQWKVQEHLAYSWRTVKVFKGSKADVQTVLGMFVWWAAGAVLWD